MEAAYFPKMFVSTYKTIRCHKTDDHNLNAGEGDKPAFLSPGFLERNEN
jgi:hypothetical protein